MRLRLIILFAVLTASQAWSATPDALTDALKLQRDGKNVEALRALGQLVPQLRASNDLAGLATALAAMGDASIAVGEYQSAIRSAQEAFDLHERLARRADAAWDLNAIGLSHLYLAQYDAALESYERALAIDRTLGDADGEVTRLNNIGNVHYMRGRYAEASRLYEQALGKVDSLRTVPSRPRLRKLTLSNLAALYQRLGENERALDLYSQVRTIGPMQPSEEAQLLVNEGALFRRFGDPLKALETYRRAQSLFAAARHRDGEIGVWRNIGIVYALDLDDKQRALDAFDQALRLAHESSNRRGQVQALLYRGETLRRTGRFAEAATDLQAALTGAGAAGLVEEQWKTLYSLGRIFEGQGRTAEARQSFEQAIRLFESMRADLRTPALKSEFLADKRDVYDALIALHLSTNGPSVADVFQLLERSRARTWQDRLHPTTESPSLSDVQSKIAPGTLLLEYWDTPSASALLWVSRGASGIVKLAEDAEPVQRLTGAIQRGDADWRQFAVSAGRVLLAGLPDLHGVTRLQVVPDGPLHFVPFEVLIPPGANAHDLLVERFEISYLPSAAWLLRSSAGRSRRWAWPWQRQLVALGDPVSSGSDSVGAGDVQPRLPYAREEMQSISALLPGRAELHLGAEAQKQVLGTRARGVPLVHFATHATADTRDPDRSRVLLSSAAGTPDYLFLREIYDLDLAGVQLVTMSACSTERGTVIRGEGVEGFSRALLAAGAASTVTTMWDVADRASAEFMKQFYFALAQGRTEAAALQWAKQQFVRSPLAWSHPRYWAGYVLTGTGDEHLPRVVPWVAVLGVPVIMLLAGGIATYRRLARRRQSTGASRKAPLRSAT